MSKQRQRALKHPRTIAWEQIDKFNWLSEELPFNLRPLRLHILEYDDGFRFLARLGGPDGMVIDRGGPHATLDEAKTAADTWYRFARSR